MTSFRTNIGQVASAMGTEAAAMQGLRSLYVLRKEMKRKTTVIGNMALLEVPSGTLEAVTALCLDWSGWYCEEPLQSEGTD